MALDRDRLRQLCWAIDGSHDGPDEMALWAEMWQTTQVDREALRSRTAELSAFDPHLAPEVALIIETIGANPLIFDQLDALRKQRPTHPMTALLRALLVDHVAVDPAGALQMTLAELRRVEAGSIEWSTNFEEVIVALRTIDPTWLDTVIDLLPAEPDLFDTVSAALGEDEIRLIIERLGVQKFCDSWLADSAEGTYTWASRLMFSDSAWASEETRRAILLQLIADAHGEQFWHVAAHPLEDFLNDDTARLEWMEEQAASNPRFRAALAGVWTSGTTAETAERIAAVTPDEEVEPDT